MKVKKCEPCQTYTMKTTKEPQGTLKVPQKAWQQVALDLLGLMPNRKHILVAQDTLSRFPVAKIVPNTKASTVIPALDDIYTSYEYPEKHVSDNGPPFDSKAFQDYSKEKGVRHQNNYPYHPQDNPSERFMKPLGKAIKASLMANESCQEALKVFLSAFRDTPHISTGVSPGGFLFRDGYRAGFPRGSPLTEEEIAEARLKDQERRLEIQNSVNSSVKRRKEMLEVGDKVLLRVMNRASKFDPMYNRKPCVVVEVAEKGVTVVDSSG